MAVDLKALLEGTQVLHPHEVEDKTCPVCLEDYLQGPSRELPRKLPCGHLIGTECLSVWASSQNRVASTKCPWCRQRIINPEQHKRATKAAERELVELCAHLLSCAPAFALRVAFFGDHFAPLPLAFVYVSASIVIQRWLKAHVRLGMLSLILGFCVWTFIDDDLGYVLMMYGKAPFEAAILRAYRDHTWTLLGLSLAAVLPQIFLEGLTGVTHRYYLSLHISLQMYILAWLDLDLV